MYHPFKPAAYICKQIIRVLAFEEADQIIVHIYKLLLIIRAESEGPAFHPVDK